MVTNPNPNPKYKWDLENMYVQLSLCIHAVEI